MGDDEASRRARRGSSRVRSSPKKGSATEASARKPAADTGGRSGRRTADTAFRSRERVAGTSARPRLRVVVTAGPTRERIDPVRYLSNDSSGRMGFAIAAAAASAGHEVVLVAGPVALATPPAVRRVDVESAREMLAVTERAFAEADALYMAAAVCDWRPRRKLGGKWRAKDGGADTATLDLVRNPDILARLARAKGTRLVVGFALETSDGPRRALAKLERKGADFVVLNDASALNADRTSVIILAADGSRRRLDDLPKTEIARLLVELLPRARP